MLLRMLRVVRVEGDDEKEDEGSSSKLVEHPTQATQEKIKVTCPTT